MSSSTFTSTDRVLADKSLVAAVQQACALARRHGLNLALLAAGCLVVTVPLLYGALFGTILADHADHVRFVERGIAQGVWPAHFLFHALVYGISGFGQDYARLAWASLALLSVCIVGKAWLSYFLLVEHCPPRPIATAERPAHLSHGSVLVLVVAALMLSAPILRPWWTSRVYLGQISPNVWHNPTSILCWPLVIVLFFAADAFLRMGRVRELAAVGALSALSVLVKPNYFLAFAPVYGLLALRRFGWSRTWLLSQAAMLPTVMILFWQLTASFGGSDAMRPDRHIAWLPLAAWQLYTNSIVVSLLFSLAFPLSYLAIFRRSLVNRRLLLFAWAVVVSALAWTAGFAEVHSLDGTVDIDFNFSWGAHLSLFILFLVTAMDMLDNPAAMAPLHRDPTASRLAVLPWWLLGAHAVTGVYWIVRQLIGRNFF